MDPQRILDFLDQVNDVQGRGPRTSWRVIAAVLVALMVGAGGARLSATVNSFESTRAALSGYGTPDASGAPRISERYAKLWREQKITANKRAAREAAAPLVQLREPQTIHLISRP